ncbi:MAG: hypothetical protein AAGG38_02195 [Planctomycetota bacterium]
MANTQINANQFGIVTTKGDIVAHDGTDPVRLTVGTNDQVLIADSTQASGLRWADAAGGSGGKSYIVESPLYPPDSPDTDDDEFDQANGTDPTLNGWSWGNQDGVTAEVRGGRLLMDATNSTSREIHALVKAIPSTGDYSLSTRLGHNGIANFHNAGLIFIWGTLASPTWHEIIRYLNDGRIFWSFGSGYTNAGNRGSRSFGVHRTPYLRAEFAATGSLTRMVWATSPNVDGEWRELRTPLDAQSGVRPDYAGLFINDESSATNLHRAHFDFARVNWTPDFDPATDN